MGEGRGQNALNIRMARRYFGFSIGESGVEPVRAYIANQKEHYKTIDFKDEVRAFLRKYGIEWDERYVWD